MFKIMSSFANCSVCKLLNEPSCILDTNSKSDLRKVEIIFISENPGKDEIKKEIPLIGKAGKTFRTPFGMYIKKNFKWLLTNCVLCCTLNEDGTTGNPDDEIIDLCKENCFQIIEECDPKLIVLMGTSPMKAFGLGKSGITTMRGEFYKWRDRDVLLTVHPSFVNRNPAYKESFENDIKLAAEYLGAKFKIEDTKIKLSNTKGVHNYSIPEKFYTDHRLVDVQFLARENKVLYIFRDKDNNKIYHKESDEYWCYQTTDKNNKKKIIPYDQLYQLKIPYRQKTSLNPEVTYEGDIKLTVKHAQDYYMKVEEEPETDFNILFFDIEIYTLEKVFPKPEDADHPVCMITNWYHGKFTTYVIDPNKLINDGVDRQISKNKDSEILIFNTEKELLVSWLKDLRSIDPDIICGWNCVGFDLTYIYNRLPKLKLDQNRISKFKEVSIDGYQGYADIAGLVVLDQLTLYRTYTFTKKESYALGYISQEELGKTKLDSGQYFSDLYKSDVNQAIRYNIGDVDLLWKLERKLKHVQLQNELKKICKVSFNASLRTMGLVDGLMVSYLKENGLASKNADIHSSSKIEGAYVKEPIPGVHDYIVDFDFTSLYPSLILTYNIGINTWLFKFEDTRLAYEFIYDIDNLPNEFNIIVDPAGENKTEKITKDQLLKKVKELNLTYTISGCFFKPHDKETSIYSNVLEYLLSSRKEFKKKMFDAKQKGDSDKQSLYNIRQLVFKVIANSIYGVIANNAFRFFSADLARSITLSGQEAIKHSIMEGNNFVESFKTGKYNSPDKISKDEMYGNLARYTPYVITGDTDSLFITYQDLIKKSQTHEDVMKNIKDWNDKVQEFLNGTVIADMVSKHQVPLDKNRLELKNELIIKRGLFLTKKRYAIYVINQEGRDTDEVVYMGLDVKRSDYPSFTKQALIDLLDLILKSKVINPSKLLKFVNQKEIEIIDLIRKGDKSIARPVSFTKSLKDYKRITPAVKSMLNWNKLQYHAFNTGDRGYFFKVQGINDQAPESVFNNYNEEFVKNGKTIDSICVPMDEERLPFYYVVDTKDMLRFAWTDRHTQLLAPLLKTEDSIITV